MDVNIPRLHKALSGYLGWTMQYGPPTGTRQVMPVEYDLRKVLLSIPADDPFFDLDEPIQTSFLEILDGYERKGASPFIQKSYRSLLTGFQSLYTEKVQIRISVDREWRRSAQ